MVVTRQDSSPRWLLLAAILVIAVNLRPAIAAVGPVLPLLADDLELGGLGLGLLGALPVMVFSVASIVVHRIIDRFGIERTTVLSMVVLTAATLLRSWPGPEANLWVGTVLIGAAIAVGNVTVPVIVKQDFPRSTPLVTGLYVAVLSLFAGLAAALAVPLAAASTWSWRLSLGGWALFTVTALLIWVPRDLRRRPSDASDEAPAEQTRAAPSRLWRTGAAWRLAAYMGVQSCAFYVVLNWLPSVEQDFGVDPNTAGWHMLGLQLMAFVGNMAAPALMRLGQDERFIATLPGVLLVTGSLGMLLAPGGVLLWVVVLGLGTGTAFVVSLTLIATRAESLRTAPQLSAMAQSVGYAIAAVGLLLSGVLFPLGGEAVLLVIVTVGTATAVLGQFVGRRGTISA